CVVSWINVSAISFVLSPGANVTVLGVRVNSVPAVADPTPRAKFTVTAFSDGTDSDTWIVTVPAPSPAEELAAANPTVRGRSSSSIVPVANGLVPTSAPVG